MKSIATIIHDNNFPLIILDDKGNTIYYENASGYWWNSEYDDQGNQLYSIDSKGLIRDNR